MTWKILEGSPEHFEGAPDWATVAYSNWYQPKTDTDIWADTFERSANYVYKREYQDGMGYNTVHDGVYDLNDFRDNRRVVACRVKTGTLLDILVNVVKDLELASIPENTKYFVQNKYHGGIWCYDKLPGYYKHYAHAWSGDALWCVAECKLATDYNTAVIPVSLVLELRSKISKSGISVSESPEPVLTQYGVSVAPINKACSSNVLSLGVTEVNRIRKLVDKVEELSRLVSLSDELILINKSVKDIITKETK